ncbi:hypothetical protein [Vibrio phage vB_VmeM-Yong XC32]|nr:hypothetical protein [Vibrio phage vB_VmeM-Yong XC31]QAX96433.1 hypothetical protein [Vibrio phage vB_VmeM-Yong XC32]QAX96750.1 hypothetical protein [Vibrio phage vB_VmeM-Yong MS31]QAX97069.1 hypothetical protein [Vibrio phage vB_VmeM-Yong MS32]
MFSNIKSFAVKVFFTLYAYVVSFLFGIPPYERQAIISFDISPFMLEALEEGYTRRDIDFMFDFSKPYDLKRYFELWGKEGTKRNLEHASIFAWYAWEMGVVRAAMNGLTVTIEEHSGEIELTQPDFVPFTFKENQGSPLAHEYMVRAGGKPCQRF